MIHPERARSQTYVNPWRQGRSNFPEGRLWGLQAWQHFYETATRPSGFLETAALIADNSAQLPES